MKTEGEGVVLFPEGHIDSGNAGELDRALQSAMRDHPGAPIILDLERLDYISSAGLRVLLAASRRLEAPLTLRNTSPEVYDIMEMTGFTSILNVERRLREMDVSGCEVIGRGAIGTVYRVDPDTIVKVYEVPDALEMIRNEQRRAKQAFLKGVPTAISYDAVRVGDRYGSVFEMIDAKTLNDLLIARPESAGAIIRQYARVIRQVHDIEAEPGELPDCRDIFLEYLDAIGAALPPKLAGRLEELFRAMPADLHLIHGDFHMKNVMLSGGEPLLIDMDTLSTGNPVFDFAGIFVAYQAFNEDEPTNSEVFLGISREMCDRIWTETLEYCIGSTETPEGRARVDRIRIVGYVRFLYLLTVLKLGDKALLEIRVRHATQRLNELVAGATTLGI